MRALGVDRYRNVVVLTGAGVSVASGLRPYRGPGGLWEEAGVAELATPSLYDEVLRLADRHGLKMPAAVLARDVRETHSFGEGVLDAWREVYEAPETHWMLYEPENGFMIRSQPYRLKNDAGFRDEADHLSRRGTLLPRSRRDSGSGIRDGLSRAAQDTMTDANTTPQPTASSVRYAPASGSS